MPQRLDFPKTLVNLLDLGVAYVQRLQVKQSSNAGWNAAQGTAINTQVPQVNHVADFNWKLREPQTLYGDHTKKLGPVQELKIMLMVLLFDDDVAYEGTQLGEPSVCKGGGEPSAIATLNRKAAHQWWNGDIV
jgi:hypothetical protein